MPNTRWNWIFAAGVAGLLAFETNAQTPGDPRFFGEYCGTYRETQRLLVPLHPLLPIPVRRTFHADLDIRANMNYRESQAGIGLIMGRGRARIEGTNFPGSVVDLVVGDVFPFVLTGVVRKRGEMHGSLLLAGREPVDGFATLSADGREWTARGFERVVTLSKTGCGNTPPSATIEQPAAPTVRWREVTRFSATVSDAEDTEFPDERLVWVSNRDGRLGTGRSIWKNTLSPGWHTITFTVTDSGGLSASASKSIEVENHRPEATIHRPEADDLLYEGVPITFRGSGFDREMGNLTEGLSWSFGGSALGDGTVILATLPAGIHEIRLSASDGELTGHDEVTIRVRPRPAGNLPPGVSITAPPRNSAPVSDREGDCLTLAASALDPDLDPEDGPLTGSAVVWTDQMEGSEPRTISETGASVEACDFASTGGDTWHTITVTATDSDGATATDFIRILVIGGGLI